jgi:hypothetical protein
MPDDGRQYLPDGRYRDRDGRWFWPDGTPLTAEVPKPGPKGLDQILNQQPTLGRKI